MHRALLSLTLLCTLAGCTTTRGAAIGASVGLGIGLGGALYAVTPGANESSNIRAMEGAAIAGVGGIVLLASLINLAVVASRPDPSPTPAPTASALRY